MTVYIIIAIVVILLIYILLTYNSLVKLINRVDEAFSTMDVYLKKRWDLIPNIVETVKGYAKHEKEVLTEISNIRKLAESSKDEKEKIQSGLKKILNCVSFLSFPLMVFFIICAEPIFDFLFTDIWKPSIPYFKYLCLVGMMVSVNTINTNLIKATGKKRE